MSFQEIQDYLFNLRNKGSRMGLERMTALSEAIGHPEKTFPCIHVAGTNGKGSTCAMLESIYRGHGLRVGLYTSPHLVYLGERIQVNRKAITETEIMQAVAWLKPIAAKVAGKDESLHATFFEFMTAIAFRHFAEQKVDIAIIETGLGGRLDSTNIVSPLASVITSIGLDHQEYLGNTIEAIAFEKAGIIKDDTPLIIGKMPANAEAVIREIAMQKKAAVYSVNTVFGETINPAFPVTNLRGSFQRVNAAVASLTVDTLQKHVSVSKETVASALKKVRWDGRWQEMPLDGNKTLVLDGSHNEEGVANIEELLSEWVSDTGIKPLIIASSMTDYRAEKLFPVLGKFAEKLSLIEVNAGRGLHATQMLAYAAKAKITCPAEGITWDQLLTQEGKLTDSFSGKNILVTGSLYLIGEFMQRFHPDKKQTLHLQDKL